MLLCLGCDNCMRWMLINDIVVGRYSLEHLQGCCHGTNSRQNDVNYAICPGKMNSEGSSQCTLNLNPCYNYVGRTLLISLNM